MKTTKVDVPEEVLEFLRGSRLGRRASAVSDAGPLIHLSWLDRLGLLRELFAEVLVPVAVHDDVLRADPEIPGVAALRAACAAGWLAVQPVAELSAVARIAAELDRGESEAIVLMREARADVLLLDERGARSRGPVPAVAPLLEGLRRRGFRASAELVEQIQREESVTGSE